MVIMLESRSPAPLGLEAEWKWRKNRLDRDILDPETRLDVNGSCIIESDALIRVVGGGKSGDKLERLTNRASPPPPIFFFLFFFFSVLKIGI